MSSEFTIEKPYITFKIGGGNFPGQACLNLVADGQVIRTATVNGTPDLMEEAWDVSEFAGKKVRLEIVDATASEQRGYILVDDIRFSVVPPDALPSTTEEEGTYITRDRSVREVLQYFAESIADSRAFDVRQVFGVDSRTLRALSILVCQRMIAPDMDHVPGQLTRAALAQRIRRGVKEVLGPLEVAEASVLGQRLLASGICDWVRTHMLYNNALGDNATPRDIKQIYWTTDTLLRAKNLYGVCAGYTRLTLDLSKQVGLECTLVNGLTRWGTNQFVDSPVGHHSWLVYAFRASVPPGRKSEQGAGDLFYCPADTTQGRVALERARKQHGHIPSPYCLPIHPIEWGYFVWREFGTDFDGRKPIPAHHPILISRWTLEEWKSMKPQGVQSLYRAIQPEMDSATVNHIPAP